jgi:hypothetical protein
MNRNEWAHNFIDRLGGVHGDHNAWALVSWMQAEGGNATWNPLNCTQKMPGSTDYNSVGVQNYVTYEQGLEATVKTILSTNPNFNYGPIRNALRTNDRANITLKAVEDSAWGTGGLALKVLPFVKADYWRYASHPIAGS